MRIPLKFKFFLRSVIIREDVFIILQIGGIFFYWFDFSEKYKIILTKVFLENRSHLIIVSGSGKTFGFHQCHIRQRWHLFWLYCESTKNWLWNKNDGVSTLTQSFQYLKKAEQPLKSPPPAFLKTSFSFFPTSFCNVCYQSSLLLCNKGWGVWGWLSCKMF